MGYTGKEDTSGHMTPMEYAHVVMGGSWYHVDQSQRDTEPPAETKDNKHLPTQRPSLHGWVKTYNPVVGLSGNDR